MPVSGTGAYTQVNFYPIFKEKRVVFSYGNKTRTQIVVLGVLALLSALMSLRIKAGPEYCKTQPHTSTTAHLCCYVFISRYL